MAKKKRIAKPSVVHCARVVTAALTSRPSAFWQLDRSITRLAFNLSVNRGESSTSPDLLEDDISAVHAWLERYRSNPKTYRAYLREATRFLLWCYLIYEKPVSQLWGEDFIEYQEFLQNPPDDWCGPHRQLSSDGWRPFRKPFNVKNCQYAFLVLRSFYTFLAQIEYLRSEPMRRSDWQRQAPESQSGEVAESAQRHLERSDVKEILDYLEAMPRKTPEQIAGYERLRYLFALFYLLGPRLSEVHEARMSSFHGWHGQWWWHTEIRRRGTVDIPLSAEMLDALKRYRAFLGWSPLPGEPADNGRPLAPSQDGTKVLGQKQIYLLISELCRNTAKRLKKKAADAAGEEKVAYARAAERLALASPEWLRRTHAAHVLDGGARLSGPWVSSGRPSKGAGSQWAASQLEKFALGSGKQPP